MSIAPVNCLVLQLLDEKAELEMQRMVIDARRQTLAYQSGHLYEEYSVKLAERNLYCNDDESSEVDSVGELQWKEFKVEYEAATARLDSQDKALEMQRTNIQTKIDAITTEVEGAQKTLQKNVENEMKVLAN